MDKNRVKIHHGADCSGAIIRREFFNDKEFTGDISYEVATDWSPKGAPMVEIIVHLPYFAGITEVMRLQDSLFDLDIGIIFEVQELKSPDSGRET